MTRISTDDRIEALRFLQDTGGVPPEIAATVKPEEAERAEGLQFLEETGGIPPELARPAPKARPTPAAPSAQQAAREPTLYDVPQRGPNASELEHFRLHPENAGMATDDDSVILNPFSTLNPEQKEAVLLNERARVHMRRSGRRPTFALTPEQRAQFKDYSADEQDIRETVAARILSGDPSAGNVTPEQTEWVQANLQAAPQAAPSGEPVPGKEVPPRLRAGVSIPTPEGIQRRPMDWKLPEEALQRLAPPAWKTRVEGLLASAAGLAGATPHGAALLHKVLIPWMETQDPGLGDRFKTEIARQLAARRATQTKVAEWIPQWVPLVGAEHDPVMELYTLWMNMGLTGAVGQAAFPGPVPSVGPALAPPPLPATAGSVLATMGKQGAYTAGVVGSLDFAQEMNRTADFGKAFEAGSRGALAGFGIGMAFGAVLNKDQIKSLWTNRVFRQAHEAVERASLSQDPKAYLAAQERMVRLAKKMHQQQGDTAAVALADKALSDIAGKKSLSRQADVLMEMKAVGAIRRGLYAPQTYEQGLTLLGEDATRLGLPSGFVKRGIARAQQLKGSGLGGPGIEKSLRGFVTQEAQQAGATVPTAETARLASQLRVLRSPETWQTGPRVPSPFDVYSGYVTRGAAGAAPRAAVAPVTGEEAPWFQRPTPRAPSLAPPRGLRPTPAVREALRGVPSPAAPAPPVITPIVPAVEAVAPTPGAAAQYAPAFRLPTGKVVWDAKATTHEDLMGRVSPLMARLIEKAIRGDYATPEDLGWVNKETGAFVVAREGAKLEAPVEAAAPTPGSRADLVAQVAAMRAAGEEVTPESVAERLAVGRDVAETLIGEGAPPAAEAAPAPRERIREIVSVPSNIGTIRVPRSALMGSLEENLETIFEFGNPQEGSRGYGFDQPDIKRSLSMGDTIEFEGKKFLVMPSGWQDVSQLDEAQVDQLVGELKVPLPGEPVKPEPGKTVYEIRPEGAPEAPPAGLAPGVAVERSETAEVAGAKVGVRRQGEVRAAPDGSLRVVDSGTGEASSLEGWSRADLSPDQATAFRKHMAKKFPPVPAPAPETPPAPAEPPVAAEKPAPKPTPVEERLGLWLRTQSGAQLAKTARTMRIKKRPDVDAKIVQQGRAAKHLREVRATVNEKAVDAELDRLGVGVVSTPLLDWLKGDRINAWKGLAFHAEIREACAGRPALAKRFVFKQPAGPRPPGGYLDTDAESAARDPTSGFRGTGPSEFLEQLARESDLRAQTGDVSKLPLAQKLQRLATAAHEAGDEPAASDYESQIKLVLQAQEWETEATDALRESIGRYVEAKAPGAGLEWARATPAAREAAEQLGVRLSEVSATGKDGAILEKDVRRAALTRDKATTARVRSLRQKIRATVAERGLPESEWRALAKDVSGHRHLTATRVTEEHLQEILRRVQAARPRQVRRGTGFVKVIRPKTEQKIQTLKEGLGTIGQMTDADFNRILKGMGIREPRYVSARKFITESQGHDILRAMLDEAPIIGKRTARESALAFPHKDAPENVRDAYARVDGLIKEKGAKAVLKPYPAKVSPLWDMRYYAQFWEERTGAPMSEAVQDVLDVRAGIERAVETGIHDRLAQAVGEKELARLTADPAACARIEDWCASELKRGGPPKPEGITPEEVAVAKTIQAILKDYELPVRIARFMDFWENDAKIPDATPEQLRAASDILETRGHEALAEHLATQTWGIIESGYTPLSVVKPKVRTYRLPPTALGKGHLRSRGGLYLEQEKTIFQRINSYAYQVLGLTRLRAPIRTFVRVFDEASIHMKDPQKPAAMFSTWLNEVRGYAAMYHPMSAFVRRVYAQSMTAVVLIDPRKWVRNKFQNLAFYPDRADFLNPQNKTLTPEDREYFREHVSQRFGLLQHYFMRAEKPFLGFRHITEWARKVSLYPLTDETNRWECFWAKINRVRRALAAHPKDAEAMQQAARMTDLELVQRREALRILAADGPDAMARYVAGQVTYNIHFAYDRAMRSPIEQGDIGRVLGNLMTFPRSYGQQLMLSARQITHGETPGVRVRGFKKFVNLIAGATAAGWVYMTVTGDKRNPYNPMNVLRWNMGGLSVGACQEGFETMGDIGQAIRGDKRALDRLAVSIPRCADLFVPFYTQLLRGTEGLTGFKNIDRLALRKVRAMVDDRYGGPQAERYKVDRNAAQMMQKILFGSEPPEPEKPAEIPAAVAEPPE